MVMFGVSPLEPQRIPVTRDSRTKNLIMKAWRERWTDVQWGIHVRTLIDNNADTGFIADCILQQALNGPGPNSLVLSYLMHSFYSQIVSAAAVLKSISQYDGYHKPFCISSLLDLLHQMKNRLVVSDPEDIEECIQLAVSLESVFHWLLTCMYSSLERLFDLPVSEVPVEDENTKIVTNCRNLLDYYLQDSYISSLLNIAIIEDRECYEKIKRMCGEIAKFSEGPQGELIKDIIRMVNLLQSYRGFDIGPGNKILPNSADGLEIMPLHGAVQVIVTNAALFGSSKSLQDVALDLRTVKDLENMNLVSFYNEIIHASIISLINAVGTTHELRFIGFVFLQLPALLGMLQKQLDDYSNSVAGGLDIYLSNESALDIVDTTLQCYSLELLLTSFQRAGLVDDAQKSLLLAKKGPSKATQMPNSSNAVLIMKAESTLASILKTLDGDFGKNQEAILGVLCEMLGARYELILTAASTTGALQQLTSRLIKLNQYSRTPNGEGTKGSNTRAMIFDVSFLMLCRTLQIYGSQAIEFDEPDCFFEDWYHNCMVEEGMARNPDNIISRCDQAKVDALLNQFLQGEAEIKFGTVYWHDICTNAVGVMQNLLYAWENNSASFQDVKKIVDLLRSKMCCLPVCISAWICSYIQVTPEEQCGKARYLLDYFLKPPASDGNQDQFKERSAMMCAIVSKMMAATQASKPQLASGSKDNKSSTELLQSCWQCISSKGLVDVDTAANLKSLMNVCGHANFIQLLLQEIFQQQYTLSLAQWCNIAHGIFVMDLKNCTESCLGFVLPTLMKFSVGSQYFVEPQLIALVALVVNSITAYYRHAKMQLEPFDHHDDSEPLSKRRKLLHHHKDNEVFSVSVLESLLKDLFMEFEKLICHSNDASPQALFVLRFIQQMCVKLPDLNLLHCCPDKLIMQLLNLMPELISSKLLVCSFKLSDRVARRKCARAVCVLQSLQFMETDLESSSLA